MGVRDAGRARAASCSPRSSGTCWRRTRSPGRCGCWTRSSTPRTRTSASTSSPRCSRATSPATSATRPRRSSCSTTWRALKHARVPPLVAPYLADMDEGVRYAAVEALLRQARRGGGARAAARLLRPRKRACGCASASPTGSPSWAGCSGDRRADVEKLLPDAFTIDPQNPRAAEAASRRNPEPRSNRRRAQARRHQDRHAHRLGADRHRPGLRVRLLGHPGGQGAARKRATGSCW